MTRGRRKDTTLPPSRTLMIQRAYRDRRAKYLAELEERCRKTEKENERLRKELELVRSQSAVGGSLNIELAPACSDLMQNLERTQKVLSLFQQRALGARPPEQSPESERVVPSATELDIAAILSHSLRQDPPDPATQQPPFGNGKNACHCQSPGPPLNATVTTDNNDGSGCCSGLFDCSALAE